MASRHAARRIAPGRPGRRFPIPQSRRFLLSLFRVDDLAVSFGSGRSRVSVVEGVSFGVDAGETLGIVGESGCGKSVTVMSSIRLLPSPPSHIDRGRVMLRDVDVTALSRRQLRPLWGGRIGVVFQDPMTSLNPTFTIGFQLREALKLHRQLEADVIEERVLAMLARVGISAPARRLEQYPHELSGGLRQRVMIAMALICEPELLIADEPTTALDVTLQAQILAMLQDLRRELGMGIVLITHDLGVVAGFCDRVAVMYAGRIVEQAPVRALFAAPRHPYTHGLLASIPRLDTPKGRALPVIEGMVPAPGARPAGCAFARRCARAVEACRSDTPVLAGGDHTVACWNPLP
ncbi:MAG: ABC transporter ATP-binding protein [Burkholderiales bacterium]|nr:ABC transporter ATP-binding protein [Burkholderiales bacterium]